MSFDAFERFLQHNMSYFLSLNVILSSYLPLKGSVTLKGKVHLMPT